MSSALRVSALSLFLLGCAIAGCSSTQTQRAPTDRSTVTAEDLENSSEPIEVVLQKKVRGLLVTRTGDGGVSLQIRASSFGGNANPPLYILDGMPFHPGPDGALTGVDPHAIETIKVLRDAEAALYGVQGANGVIVITTKKAVRNRR